MKLKLLTEDKEGIERFVDFIIDYNKIVGYWIIPSYVDEDINLTVESDEMNIILSGNILTIKVNQDLIKLLESKI